MKKIITWVKPTWEMPHIGNLVWAILPFKKMSEQKDIDASLFIADLHALTSIKDAKMMRDNTRNLALTYYSIFWLDTKVTIFRQSDIILIPKLNWVLNNVTPYSLMLRAHSFKDFQQKTIMALEEQFKTTGQLNAYKELFEDYKNEWKDTTSLESKLKKAKLNNITNIHQIEIEQERFEKGLNMWVFNYPILMAADILAYDIDIVPVGADQKQHLEMTRDIAKAFNKTYGKEIFKIPKEHIEKNVATIPWLDWRKMSKSYNNFIWVFEDEKSLKKKVMAISTDSKWLEDIKDPETCNVFALIKLFWWKDKIAEIDAKYRAWGYWYWHAKQELFEILNSYLGEFRKTRDELAKNYDVIEDKLKEWARIMNARIEEKMKEVSEVVGV